jgi:hypothetical protein
VDKFLYIGACTVDPQKREALSGFYGVDNFKLLPISQAYAILLVIAPKGLLKNFKFG